MEPAQKGKQNKKQNTCVCSITPFIFQINFNLNFSISTEAPQLPFNIAQLHLIFNMQFLDTN